MVLSFENCLESWFGFIARSVARHPYRVKPAQPDLRDTEEGPPRTEGVVPLGGRREATQGVGHLVSADIQVFDELAEAIEIGGVRLFQARGIAACGQRAEGGHLGDHVGHLQDLVEVRVQQLDRKSTRLNSSHLVISYAVFCLKKKK